MTYKVGDVIAPASMMVKTADIVNGNLWRVFPLIEVPKVKLIPSDYLGPIAAPITLLDKFCNDQFEMIGLTHHHKLVDGRTPYRRIVIRHLKPELPEEIDLAAYMREWGIPFDCEFIASNELPIGAMMVHGNGI